METLKDNLTGTNTEGPSANTPLKYLTASSIIGDEIRNTADERLGQITDIMLNVQTGAIDYYLIEFGGLLGIGEKFFALPFRLLTVDPQKQVFIFDLEKDLLETAPGFDKDHWPETNAHYYDDADKHWNFM